MKTITESEASKIYCPMIYTLVVSLDEKEKPNALGVSWVTRTSIDPHLFTISIDTRRYSHDSIMRRKEFVICYPSESQAKGAWLCGVKSGRDMDKIQEAGFSLVPSKSVSVPTIEGVTVAFECKVVSHFTTGDHTVFVGEVTGITGSPETPAHLYYSRDLGLFALDAKGNINLSLEK